jgi:hypothetical protein
MCTIILIQPPFPEMLSNSPQHPCLSNQNFDFNSTGSSDLDIFLPNKLDPGQTWVLKFSTELLSFFLEKYSKCCPMFYELRQNLKARTFPRDI